MAITWHIEPPRETVALTIVAPYTMAEWRRAIDDILAAAHGNPLRLLIDRRAAGTPTTEVIDDIIGHFRLHSARLSGSKAAVVVGGETTYGVAHMLELRAEVSRIAVMMKIFLEYEDAVRWLSRDELD